MCHVVKCNLLFRLKYDEEQVKSEQPREKIRDITVLYCIIMRYRVVFITQITLYINQQ